LPGQLVFHFLRLIGPLLINEFLLAKLVLGPVIDPFNFDLIIFQENLVVFAERVLFNL